MHNYLNIVLRTASKWPFYRKYMSWTKFVQNKSHKSNVGMTCDWKLSYILLKDYDTNYDFRKQTTNKCWLISFYFIEQLFKRWIPVNLWRSTGFRINSNERGEIRTHNLMPPTVKLAACFPSLLFQNVENVVVLVIFYRRFEK